MFKNVLKTSLAGTMKLCEFSTTGSLVKVPPAKYSRTQALDRLSSINWTSVYSIDEVSNISRAIPLVLRGALVGRASEIRVGGGNIRFRREDGQTRECEGLTNSEYLMKKFIDSDQLLSDVFVKTQDANDALVINIQVNDDSPIDSEK